MEILALSLKLPVLLFSFNSQLLTDAGNTSLFCLNINLTLARQTRKTLFFKSDIFNLNETNLHMKINIRTNELLRPSGR